MGFKIHEDYGAYPEVIDRTLAYADAHDVAVSLHTDGLHESAELEDTVAAIAGRTVHAYHVEGTGGGHVPDLIGLVREASILCSSTTPTLPWGVAAAAEHVAMTLLNHGGNPWLPGDVALVRERIHPATMAAEGPLHELGAIGIVNSDSQGMGRIGETLRRTLQLAHVMKAWRGSEAGSGWPGLPRRRRPVRRQRAGAALPRQGDVEPAIVHGIWPTRSARSDPAGWPTSSSGSRRSSVSSRRPCSRAGTSPGRRSATATPASSGAEPTRFRPDWGGHGLAPADTSVTFVSAAGLAGGIAARLGTRRRIVAVRGCRGLTRSSLVGESRRRPGRRWTRSMAGSPSTGGRWPSIR